MGLMSPSLLWLLGLLTVGLPLAAVALWRRIPGRPPWPALGRLSLVVASQVAAVMLVAAAVNDYGYFYGSWSELAGAAGLTNATTAVPRLTIHGGPHLPGGAAVAPLAAVGHISVQTYPGFSSPSQWALRGHLESIHVTGPITRLSTQAFVYLPPQYYQHRYAHQQFPAALVLTGFPTSDQSLIARMKYQDALLRDIRRHEARPMVLVMMQPSVTFPRDTECTDVPGGPQVQTFLSQDVPSEISHRYRVASSGWGAIGASTGGYCATKLSMMNPTTFPAAVSISGYYRTLHDYTTGSLWGGSAVVRNLNNPEWRMTHLPAPPVSLLLQSSKGETGRLGLPDMQRFLKLVKPPTQVSTLVTPTGGHNYLAWAPLLPSALHWLSAHLPTTTTHA